MSIRIACSHFNKAIHAFGSSVYILASTRSRRSVSNASLTWTKRIAWNRESTQLLSRWLFLATLSWCIGSLLVTQLRAPFSLRSIAGWQDALKQLMWTAPFELAPLGIVVSIWIVLLRVSARVRTRRISHVLSLATTVPVLLTVELAASSILLLAIGSKPGVTQLELLRLAIDASLENGQPLDWLITNVPMIVVPRMALSGWLGRSGLIKFR